MANSLKSYQSKIKYQYSYIVTSFVVIVLMIKSVQDGSEVKLWKNVSEIGSNGLVKCHYFERMFNTFQCTLLMEDLLRIYQQKGLKLHYAAIINLDQSTDTEKITYKCFKGNRCPLAKQREYQIQVGEFEINYKIIRLSPQTSSSKYPYLLLFDTYCGDYYCRGCDMQHSYKVVRSSFYVIRSQFISQLAKKITFMQRYPRYIFRPWNFVSKQWSGDTVYQHIDKGEMSYYVETCQNYLGNFTKLQMIKHEMDCETVRLQLLSEANSQLLQKYKKKMILGSFCVKLRYVCRKQTCNQSWSTRKNIIISSAVFELRSYFRDRLITIKPEDQKYVFQGSVTQAKYRQLFKKEEVVVNTQERPSLGQLFQIPERSLDKSIQKEYEQLQIFQRDMQGCFAFHQKFADYKWPYLIVFNMQVPKMNCHRCQKEKDGLVYISHLISLAYSTLNSKIIQKIKEIQKKKEEKGQRNGWLFS